MSESVKRRRSSEMSENIKRRRSSRRRSSFVAGRQKLQQSGAFGGDLHKSIDEDKSPEERMAMLTRLCVKYTLQKRDEEVTDEEDCHSLQKKELETAGLHQIAELEENGTFKRACRKEKSLPNPVNLEMDQTIVEAERHIKRLEQQIVSWEDVFNQLEKEAEDFQKKDREIKESQLSPEVKKISEKFLLPNTDYQTMLTDLDKDMEATKFYMNKFCTANKMLLQACRQATKIYEKQIPKLQVTFQESTVVDSPRRLIERVIMLPS